MTTRVHGEFTKAIAYLFRSPLSLGEMLERLNDRSGRRWSRSDRDDLGECVGSDTKYFRDDEYHTTNWLRVYMEGDDFVVDILYRTEAPWAEEEWPKLFAYVHETLLPLVEARDVRETKGFSS